MSVIVTHLSPDEWRHCSESAHEAVFSEFRPSGLDRIDYVLVAYSDGAPIGYVTCREHDARTLYWQLGGAFPEARLSISTIRGYEAFIDWARERGYLRIHTLIENDNIRYLKLAMAKGFRIVGVRYFKGKVLCDLELDFEGQ